MEEKNKILSVHNFFVVSVILKGLNAVLELMGGLAAFFVTKPIVIKIVELLARNELAEDPSDIVANYFIHLAYDYSSSFQIFISVYLLIHGAAKLFLVYNLLKKRLWAYPSAIAVFSLFVVYQIYAYIISPSFSLIFLTMLDILIIILTLFEYKNLKKQKIEIL